MSRLMTLTQKLGHEVSGSDEKTGGYDLEKVRKANLVVYSSAIKSDDAELLCAKKRGVKTIERAEYLGAIAEGHKRVIAISGTHGKTTTTAMLAECLRSRFPTLHVGAKYPFPEGNEGLFITEACEYKRSFLALKPDVAVILNAELEHIDCYKNKSEVLQAFAQFSRQSAVTVYNGDDRDLAEAIGNSGVSFGFSESNDFRAVNLIKNADGAYSFSLIFRGKCLGDINLSIMGKHNVLNALAAISVAVLEGESVSKIRTRMQNFSGIERRVEFLTRKNGVDIYTDYAHHPSEIDALYETLKDRGKVAIVFQPHTFSRTEKFLQDFVAVLSKFDKVILTPVYGAREKRGRITSRSLGELLKNDCVSLDDYSEVFQRLDDCAFDFSVVAFVGAGDIDQRAKEYAFR